MKKTFEITKPETLTALLQAFPRTLEAKRLIGDGDVWRVSVDPEAEEEAEAKATSVVMDGKTGEILGAFNPYVGGWFPFPFNIHGTKTGRTSSAAPNESNPPKAEEYGVHKDAVDCWAATDFAGLEKRVNQLRNAKDRFKKNKDQFEKNRRFAEANHQADKDDADRDALEDVIEAMADRLDNLDGKVDAVRDNQEDNLGRLREVDAMVRKVGASKHDPGNPVGWNGEQLDAMGEQVNRLTRKVDAVRDNQEDKLVLVLDAMGEQVNRLTRGLEAVKADVILVNNRIDAAGN